ncbi:MAG: NADP-dependent malic enzyme, partial [Candidatus Nanohaloarchaea archaeon]
MGDEDPLAYHRDSHGKIAVEGKVPVETEADMSLAYTPGVAEPSRAIADDPAAVYDYTVKGEMAGILSDGSAVLGLGDIGPEAAIPVMEGKALLIRELADVSAFPLVVDTDGTDDLIATGERLHPMLGFLMLEDISSPACFEVEERLKEELDIPVFHDDQHGAAIAVLAGLRNAFRITDRDVADADIVVIGAGAAGIATADLLLAAGAGDVTLVDTPGIIHGGMDLPPHQHDIADRTNPDRTEGDLADALDGADACIGLSTGGIVSKEMVRSMADDPVVFAMANPDPEIPYPDAVDAGAAVAGTGRSDFP